MTYKKQNFGFTLTELMVTMSIVSVIMAVILFNYSTFNDSLTTAAAVQEVSLAIREAQAYGLSVREGSVGSGDYSKGYGISFSRNDPYNYYLFRDADGDGRNNTAYNSCTGECIQKVPLRNKVRIFAICGSILTANACAAQGATSVHITFIRPNPEAIIKLYTAANVLISTNYRGMITFYSTRNKSKTVTIEQTGQIYVR